MKSTLRLPCPVCKSGLNRVAYWNNIQGKYVRHDTLFICIKCERLEQFEYSHKPKIKRGRKPKNDTSI